MTYAVIGFVEEKLGSKYISGSNAPFSESFKESGSSTPMFFILSPGVDPLHYGLRPIERGQFRFFRFCMKISLSLSNSMIFSRSPLLKTRKNAKIGFF